MMSIDKWLEKLKLIILTSFDFDENLLIDFLMIQSSLSQKWG